MTIATRDSILEDHVADFDQASDPKTSVSKLKELMKSKQHTVVAAVASHPSATAGMLNVMSMHDHPAVRKCVACHPNTHLTTLWNLHGDSSKHVRTAVSENPNIPKGLKGGLSDTADRSEEMPVHTDDPRYDFLGESENYHSVFARGHDHRWQHHFDADNKTDAEDEMRHLRSNGVAKPLRLVVPKAHADWTKVDPHEYVTGRLGESLNEDFSQMPRQALVRKYKEYATKAIEHHKALNDPHPVFPKTVEGWHKLRLDHFLHGAKEIKKELEDRRANGIRESESEYNPKRTYDFSKPHEERPLAAHGLTSYRHPNEFGGHVMIGARDHEDALRQAGRSTRNVSKDKLEVWNGSKYIKAHG